MKTVGVRELKEHTSEVLRTVYDGGEEVSITLRGREVARIVPVSKQVNRERLKALWADMDKLAADISAVWPKGVSAVDAVREQRRDL